MNFDQLVDAFHGKLDEKLNKIIETQAKIMEVLMSVQDDINAADAAVVAATDVLNQLVAVVTADGGAVSTAQLDTDVAALETATASGTAALSAGGTTPPPTTPAPAPAAQGGF
jgi:hypothetical protein